MSRRNPQNERYTVEREGRSAGSTKPKAGSAKPASKAAASVRVENPKAKKTRKQKLLAPDTMSKEEKKAARAKEREVENMAYTATTVLTNADAKYKKLRRIWWGLLIAAVVFTAISWLTLSTNFGGQVFSIVVLVLAYVSIIGALVMDFTVIRKRRNVFRDRVNAMSKKQVEHIVEESYLEHDAKDAARKARKEAKKAGQGAEAQEAAAQKAYDEVMASHGKRKAEIETVSAAAADAASNASAAEKPAEEAAVSPEEEARLAAARKAARDFAASKGRM